MAATRSASSVFRSAFAYHSSETTHWFPGHMKKGILDMQKLFPRCSCVVEVHDARIPFTGRNRLFEAFHSRHVLVLNKADLADPKLKKATLARLREAGEETVLFTNSTSEAGHDKQKLLDAIIDISERQGSRRTSPEHRVLIAGMPNVGKSSLINALRRVHLHRAKCAVTGDRPGVTRALQTEIKVSERPLVLIHDTPGVMIPRIDSDHTAMTLAAMGTLRDELVGLEYIADFVLFTLNRMGRFEYCERYGLSSPTDNIDELLSAIAIRIGSLLKGGAPNRLVAATRFVREFRSGVLGLITLGLPARPARVAAPSTLPSRKSEENNDESEEESEDDESDKLSSHDDQVTQQSDKVAGATANENKTPLTMSRA
eukprot:m.40124 g.40124  ORF g.40124 m.40124 type:complete len:372 (-) comp10272_c1_seq1:27-1142(-)